jgi:high-affinity iron transporter
VGGSLLITLREGLEISLVVAIVLAYLRQSDRRALFRPVWAGTGAAVAVCLGAGIAFYNLVGDLAGRTEAIVEGGLAISATAVLTWMIFWMRSHARGISGQLHARVDAAAEQSHTAIAIVAFVAVAREGFETVLFLLGAKVNAGASSGWPVVTGGLIGLAVAAFLGYLIYQGGHRVDLRRFFQVTGGLLILFAAGLFAKGLHELFVEAAHGHGALAHDVWTVHRGAFAHGWLKDFLEGMFGWTPDEATVIRIIGYVVYLVPIGWLYFLGGRRPKATPSPEPARAEALAA